MWKVVVAAAFAGIASAAPSHSDLHFAPINEFSLRLLDNTYAFQDTFGNKNVAISPLAIWSILSLLAEGSAGATFLELMRELRLPNDLRATQALHRAANSILRNNNQDQDVILKGQSAMFSDCTLQIHPDFCQSALTYDTDIYSVDPYNSTKLASDINYYICLATDGKIINAVRPELVENLRMILVDALYFKASWTHPFDPTQTKEETFYNYQGKTIGSVNMMYHKAPHYIGDLDEIEAQVLEMTYGKNGQFSMLILLPYDGTPIKKLLNNLANKPLDWMTQFTTDESLPNIDCFIPRFKLATQTDLKPPLQYSGIQTIFDKEKAELPGVSDSSLYVSTAVQNVNIEVTEEGTVAASSTVVGLEDRILAQRFEANKEFVFLITERNSNVILFAGVYAEPMLV